MKFINLIAASSIALAAVSCSGSRFAPSASPNPWADDYSSVSSMDNYRSWGTYNVHDPAITLVGDTFYMYSTDAIFRENRDEARRHGVKLGFVQMRKSTDLVNWEFAGWAFSEIPAEAKNGSPTSTTATAQPTSGHHIWSTTETAPSIYIIVYRLSAVRHLTSVSPRLPPLWGRGNTKARWSKPTILRS